MKNQYFGDINDYLKYGLLRILTAETGLRMAVCWMLTQDDGRPDGKKIRYLNEFATWRGFDPSLFDILRSAVAKDERSIMVAQNREVLPTAIYQSDLLRDDASSRHNYFEQTEAIATSCDLVFFDPDNGMEVKSRRKGNKDSSKYLFWDEVRRMSDLRKSLVVFQHFARVNRERFISALKTRFMSETHAAWIGAVVSPNVVFFVVPARQHEEALKKASEAIHLRWQPHLRIR